MAYLHSAASRIMVLAVAALIPSASFAIPVNLRCNNQDRPLGIDTVQPRFSWRSDSHEKGWMQSAYRIVVASSPALATAGTADIWDSGRQQSSVSVDIPYSGPALESRRRYFWTVEVWDSKGTMTHPLQSSWWEMGLLRSSDWTAKWIGAEDRTAEQSADLPWIWLKGEDALKAPARTVATFRYVLKLDGKPLRATLSAAAHGDFKVQVNSHLTGQKKEWFAFDREDIQSELHPGNNEILVSVTTPAVRGRPGAPVPADAAAQTVVAALAAVIQFTSPDGATHRVTTAEAWEGSQGTGNDWKPAQVVAKLNDPRMGIDPGLPPQPAILLRDKFTVEKPVARARLYVTAAGSYRMSINGKTVSSDVLTPDFTDYRKHVSYQTYDVTPLIAHGANAVGAILGDGWFASPLVWNGIYAFTGPTRLLAQLELQYADGGTDTIATSPEWKMDMSPIESSSIYAGEVYDARLEQRGWDTAAFVDGKWKHAALSTPPEGAVSAQIGLPVHPVKTLHPTSLTPLANGNFVFDMGQNMVGWVRLDVSGPAGRSVKLRFAERLNPDGSIYTDNLRNADAEDIYTLRGGGPETFSPRFTFHGFRYVEVSGAPSRPGLRTITGEVLSSLDGEPTGRLQTSSPLLNKMWQLGIWGQRGNFLSIPTDSPQRDERLGWMGDAGVFWRTGSYNFNIAAFSAKYMQDILDAQAPTGAFSNISPNLSRPGTGAPGWGDTGIIVPYSAWLQYGDRSLVERNWAAMERWMDFIASSNPDFLREKQLGANFGDWLAPDETTSKSLVDTAYWAIVANMMREMAQASGHDSGKYAALFDHIRNAYDEAYVKPDGTVLGGTQSSYLLTLYAGLAPEALRPAMTEKLVGSIKAHGDHLTTGFLGTPFLLFALSDNGRTDVAYDLLMQETYPSWGYMISKGATTWWERWNGDTGDPAMNSYNHYSFGSVVAWMYRDMVGIDTAQRAPGFQHLIIKPRYTKKLSYARGEYDSVYGTVKCGWTRNAAGTFVLHLVLPANTTATVYPDGDEGRVVKVAAGHSEFTSKLK